MVWSTGRSSLSTATFTSKSIIWKLSKQSWKKVKRSLKRRTLMLECSLLSIRTLDWRKIKQDGSHPSSKIKKRKLKEQLIASLKSFTSKWSRTGPSNLLSTMVSHMFLTLTWIQQLERTLMLSPVTSNWRTPTSWLLCLEFSSLLQLLLNLTKILAVVKSYLDVSQALEIMLKRSRKRRLLMINCS